VSRPKNAAVKDIDDISISSTFGGHKHRQRIDIGKRNIDPSLLINTKQNNLAISNSHVQHQQLMNI